MTHFNLYQFTKIYYLALILVVTFLQYFELKLDKFGPYRLSYTRNGRLVYITVTIP